MTVAGRILAEHAEQILALRRRAQDAINELEKVPRGELVIAANEATCIYVLPGVFAEFKKQFPNVQLLVDRSYGTRVVQAVLDNLSRFRYHATAGAGEEAASGENPLRRNQTPCAARPPFGWARPCDARRPLGRTAAACLRPAQPGRALTRGSIQFMTNSMFLWN